MSSAVVAASVPNTQPTVARPGATTSTDTGALSAGSRQGASLSNRASVAIGEGRRQRRAPRHENDRLSRERTTCEIHQPPLRMDRRPPHRVSISDRQRDARRRDAQDGYFRDRVRAARVRLRDRDDASRGRRPELHGGHAEPRLAADIGRHDAELAPQFVGETHAQPRYGRFAGGAHGDLVVRPVEAEPPLVGHAHAQAHLRAAGVELALDLDALVKRVAAVGRGESIGARRRVDLHVDRTVARRANGAPQDRSAVARLHADLDGGVGERRGEIVAQIAADAERLAGPRRADLDAALRPDPDRGLGLGRGRVRSEPEDPRERGEGGQRSAAAHLRRLRLRRGACNASAPWGERGPGRRARNAGGLRCSGPGDARNALRFGVWWGNTGRCSRA
jgi:hypothetical protein